MKVELSKEVLDFLRDYLQREDSTCDRELSALPAQHRVSNTVTFQYWVCRQIALRKALRELEAN